MWTPKRVLILLGGLAVFMTGYVLYAYFLGGIDGLPVLPEVYWAGVHDGAELPTTPIDGETETKLKWAFGNDCEEAKREIKLDLRSRGVLIAAKQFKLEDGRVKLWPFSAALFKNKGNGAYPEITTIQSAIAYLTLDAPANNVIDLNKRKITEVELLGPNGVTIINNRGTAEKNDDIELHVTQAPLFYKEVENLIWTDGWVRLLDLKTHPDPTKITALGMEIKLSPDSGPNRAKPPAKAKATDEPVNNVEMLYLRSNVHMHLYVDASSGFLDGYSEKPKVQAPGSPSEPEKAQVVVTTSGPFHYDLTKEVAWFDAAAPDQVLVSREHKLGDIKKYDQLLCDHLELKFRKKADIDPKAPRDPQAPDKEIETALATVRLGDLELNLATENLVAYGSELFFRSPTAGSGPQTTLKGSPMKAAKDGHRITARELHLVGADKKSGNGQQADAKGPGRIDLYDKSNPKNAYTSHAVWNDRLSLVKERDGDRVLDVLTLTGKASFVDELHKQEMRGERLQVWRDSDPGSGEAGSKRAANAASTANQKVRKIEAYDKVSLQSPRLNIPRTNHLTALFKYEPGVGARLPDALASDSVLAPQAARSAQTAKINPPQLNPPTTESTSWLQPPSQSSKPIELSANDVVAYITTIGDAQELQELVTEGAVHVHQEGETSETKKAGDKGFDITGEMLNLEHHPGGDTLFVYGDSLKAAKLKLGELVIIGPRVVINQSENTAEVVGAGAMSLPSKTSLQGGQAVKAGTRIEILWNKDMFFNGRYANFHGGVEAIQDSAKLKCQDLEVMLDRMVSFKEGQKENQEANVEKLVCTKDVWVEDEKRDAGGNRLQLDRLKAIILSVDKKTETTNTAGPGKVEHLALSTGDDPLTAPGPRQKSSVAKSVPVWKLTRVLFKDRMYTNENNNTRVGKFYGDVKVFHFPTENVGAPMDPDNPPKDGFYMECNILTVFTRQLGNKTSQAMEARDNVFFRTQEFFGRASEVHYDESQDQITFVGTPGNPTTLYRKDPRYAQPQEIKGSRILYNRKTGKFHADGVLVITG